MVRYFAGMKQLGLILTLTLFVSASLFGQGEVYPAQEAGSGLPAVAFNNQAVNLQASLFPDYYKEQSAARDLNWVQGNDSMLAAFWLENGAKILADLETYSGIPWHESDFDIYAVRFYPSTGSPQPLIIPLGGMRSGALTEAAPSGNSMKLDLLYLLAHRNLAQAAMNAEGLPSPVANHPLMRPDPYRRDNLAMLLALVVAQEVMGLDSTYAAFQSAFWKQHFPGRQVLEEQLLPNWILSPERPLSEWILAEPVRSALVLATRPPRPERPTTPVAKRVYIEGLPLKGKLGFSVKESESGLLEVDRIDPFRLGFACGLMEGDLIRRVDNRRVRSHKELVERILDGMATGGATLDIMRDNESHTVIIRNQALPGADDKDFWQYLDESDFPPDTTGDTTASDSL